MRAAVIERYGPPEAVVIREVPTPVPGDNDILVRIHATTVNSGDARVRALHVPGGPLFSMLMRLSLGFKAPKNPIGGFEAAGEVVSVGANVTGIKPGDRVAGSHGFRFGLHAEYATFDERAGDAIALIPEGVSYEEAVSVLFGGMTALMFFNKGKLKAGESILINGASGAVGTMAVQLAKHLGAEVTAVCSSRNAELVRSLGADHVVAYDREDFAKKGKTYEVIMDNHGNAPFSRVKSSLKLGGRFLLVIFDKLSEFVAAKWTRQVIEVTEADGAMTSEAFAQLLALTARGVLKPVIDSTYPFERIAEAHARVDSNRKRGSVVVTVP
jgi:NADPH:quinone reductase-like Zn-dependent oxidoreductase